MDSIYQMPRCGSTLWEHDYLDNEAMNGKHKDHSKLMYATRDAAIKLAQEDQLAEAKWEPSA